MQHKANAVTECPHHPGARTVLIQFFQQAARFCLHQFRQIILIIIVGKDHRRAEQAILQRLVCIRSVSLCQHLFDRLDEPLFHLPDRNLYSRSTVGAGHIKHITQLIRRIRIDQQRNAFGIAIDPSAMLIPPADFGASCRIRLLCENQQLLLKRIFEIIRRSGQKSI